MPVACIFLLHVTLPLQLGQILIKFYHAAGPINSGVVASEPGETKDELWFFTEVNHLKLDVL
jgi:hypothetical protein